MQPPRGAEASLEDNDGQILTILTSRAVSDIKVGVIWKLEVFLYHIQMAHKYKHIYTVRR